MSEYLRELLLTYKGCGISFKTVGNFNISGTVIDISGMCVEIKSHHNYYYITPLCNIMFIKPFDNGERSQRFLEQVKCEHLSESGLSDYAIELGIRAGRLLAVNEIRDIWINCVDGENYIEDIIDVIPGLIFAKDTIFVTSHVVSLGFKSNDNNE